MTTNEKTAEAAHQLAVRALYLAATALGLLFALAVVCLTGELPGATVGGGAAGFTAGTLLRFVPAKGG